MPETIKVALAQLRPELRDTAQNLRTAREVVAGHGDADLVVFPELFLSCYTVESPEELALDLDAAGSVLAEEGEEPLLLEQRQ